ncbi:MAG TPA: hypothetical protein VLL75_20750 [Vicinamibacteria bacterium]|nr:hypothetical protein [Vicinamibacteria bacterium]
MRPIPPFPLLAVAIACACGEPAPPPAEPAGSALPLDSLPLPTGESRLVSEDDTLSLAVFDPEEGHQRLFRSVSGGVLDSMAVVVDVATKRPIESYRVAEAGEGDSVTARIEYGAGFEGQARLTLGGSQGSAVENLRTPPPSLDAGQLPLTLSALRFGDADSVHFNYVAPFEKEALAARLLLGPLEPLRIGDTVSAAWPVLLQVSGLQERYWFAERPPHELLRLEEITRGRTWTRVEPAAP